MTAWDNFLFGLGVLFLLPIAAMVFSFCVSQLLQLWLPQGRLPRNSKPKSVREPIQPTADGINLQQAS